MKERPLRTTVIGSYPFPGWLEHASAHLDAFGPDDIAEIQDDAVLESRIAEFIGKVDVKVDDLNSGKFAPARVSVTTTAGTTLEAQLENVPGTLANPLSDEQIAAKFRDCAAFGLQPREPAEADALAATLSAMEKRDDLDGLLTRS